MTRVTTYGGAGVVDRSRSQPALAAVTTDATSGRAVARAEPPNLHEAPRVLTRIIRDEGEGKRRHRPIRHS